MIQFGTAPSNKIKKKKKWRGRKIIKRNLHMWIKSYFFLNSLKLAEWIFYFVAKIVKKSNNNNNNNI